MRRKQGIQSMNNINQFVKISGYILVVEIIDVYIHFVYILEVIIVAFQQIYNPNDL